MLSKEYRQKIKNNIIKFNIFLFCSLIFCVEAAFAQQTPLNTPCTDNSNLDWEMNQETDIDKYRIYSKNTAGIVKSDPVLFEVEHDSSNVIFDTNGIGHFEQVLNSTLSEGAKWFAATAVDDKGNESDLSNEVGCLLNISPVPPNNLLIAQNKLIFKARIWLKPGG